MGLLSGVLVGMVGMPSQTQASDVKGSVRLQDVPPGHDTAATDNGLQRYRWELQNGVKEVVPDSVPGRELAVVLTPATDQAQEGQDPSARQADKVTLPLSGGEPLPSTVVVGKGTTLVIENQDEIAHELRAVGFEGFGSEALGPRNVRSVKLTNTGDWPLRDALSPHARGHLHVLEALVATAQVGADGRFEFDDITPGSYVLRVFHGPHEVAAQPVAVSGKAVEVPTLSLATPPKSR